MNDRELIFLFKQDPYKAMNELARLYAGTVYAAAQSRLGFSRSEKPQVEELCSDVLSGFYLADEFADGGFSIKSTLLAMTFSAANRRIQEENISDPSLDLSDFLDVEDGFLPSFDPNDSLERQSFLQEIMRFENPDGAIFLRKYCFNQSELAISRELDIPETSVSLSAQKTLSALRSKFSGGNAAKQRIGDVFSALSSEELEVVSKLISFELPPEDVFRKITAEAIRKAKITAPEDIERQEFLREKRKKRAAFAAAGVVLLLLAATAVFTCVRIIENNRINDFLYDKGISVEGLSQERAAEFYRDISEYEEKKATDEYSDMFDDSNMFDFSKILADDALYQKALDGSGSNSLKPEYDFGFTELEGGAYGSYLRKLVNYKEVWKITVKGDIYSYHEAGDDVIIFTDAGISRSSGDSDDTLAELIDGSTGKSKWKTTLKSDADSEDFAAACKNHDGSVTMFFERWDTLDVILKTFDTKGRLMNTSNAIMSENGGIVSVQPFNKGYLASKYSEDESTGFRLAAIDSSGKSHDIILEYESKKYSCNNFVVIDGTAYISASARNKSKVNGIMSKNDFTPAQRLEELKNTYEAALFKIDAETEKVSLLKKVNGAFALDIAADSQNRPLWRISNIISADNLAAWYGVEGYSYSSDMLFDKSGKLETSSDGPVCKYSLVPLTSSYAPR